MRNKEYFTNLSSLDAGAVSTLNVIKMEKGFQYIGSIMKTKFVKKLAKSQQTKHRNNMQQKALKVFFLSIFCPFHPLLAARGWSHSYLRERQCSGPSTLTVAKTLTVPDSPPELLLLRLVSSSAPGAAARPTAAAVKAGQTQCLGAPSPWRCHPDPARPPPPRLICCEAAPRRTPRLSSRRG